MPSIKINEISVINYRGIDSLNFSPRNINIIVGPNNTGKSSLLNAISLSLHALNEFNEVKSKGFFDKTTLYPPNHQIYETNENISSIRLNLADNRRKRNQSIELIMVYGTKYPSDSFNSHALSEFIEHHAEMQFKKEMKSVEAMMEEREYSQDSIAKRRIEIRDEIFYDIIRGCSNTLFFKLKHQNNILIESYMENFKRKTRSRKRINVLQSPFRNYFKDSAKLDYLKKLYDFNLIFPSSIKKSDIIQYFKKLSQTPTFYKVLDKLKAKLDYLYDIRESEGNIYIVTLGSDNSKIFVPFELMGDGFQSLLMTTILFELLPKGIVLLEEPENGLHPGYMDLLANTILKKSVNRQFFFSTHSLDFIKFLVEKAEKTNKLDNILLLRLNRLDNKINREILLKDEILEELNEIKVDLRGY